MQRNKKPININTEEAVEIALKAAVDQKSLDVRSLDLEGISSIASYFIIASGTSERHVKGIADKIRLELSKEGYKPAHLDGYDNAEWIVMDYLDFFVHIFYEPTRQFYEFDKLWENAKPVELPRELEEAVKKLRTGMIY